MFLDGTELGSRVGVGVGEGVYFGDICCLVIGPASPGV